jgi:hypothetical protein
MANHFLLSYVLFGAVTAAAQQQPPITPGSSTPACEDGYFWSSYADKCVKQRDCGQFSTQGVCLGEGWQNADLFPMQGCAWEPRTNTCYLPERHCGQFDTEGACNNEGYSMYPRCYWGGGPIFGQDLCVVTPYIRSTAITDVMVAGLDSDAEGFPMGTIVSNFNRDLSPTCQDNMVVVIFHQIVGGVRTGLHAWHEMCAQGDFYAALCAPDVCTWDTLRSDVEVELRIGETWRFYGFRVDGHFPHFTTEIESVSPTEPTDDTEPTNGGLTECDFYTEACQQRGNLQAFFETEGPGAENTGGAPCAWSGTVPLQNVDGCSYENNGFYCCPPPMGLELAPEPTQEPTPALTTATATTTTTTSTTATAITPSATSSPTSNCADDLNWTDKYGTDCNTLESQGLCSSGEIDLGRTNTNQLNRDVEGTGQRPANKACCACGKSSVATSGDTEPVCVLAEWEKISGGRLADGSLRLPTPDDCGLITSLNTASCAADELETIQKYLQVLGCRAQPTCDQCVAKFAENGGCELMLSGATEAEIHTIIPADCDVCGEAAGKFCTASAVTSDSLACDRTKHFMLDAYTAGHPKNTDFVEIELGAAESQDEAEQRCIANDAGHGVFYIWHNHALQYGTKYNTVKCHVLQRPAATVEFYRQFPAYGIVGAVCLPGTRRLLQDGLNELAPEARGISPSPESGGDRRSRRMLPRGRSL